MSGWSSPRKPAAPLRNRRKSLKKSTNNMKKFILVAAMMITSVAAFAQSGKSIYQKYSDCEKVSAVYISPAMFKLIGQIPDLEIEDESVDLTPVIKTLKGLYLINSENPDIRESVVRDVERFVDSADYELLMEVKEEGFKGGDRTMIELPQYQRDILAALHKAGKKVILANCSGSAIGLVPEQQSTDAILQAWYGGQAGGQALAEVIFGRVNPSGKLPVTFYRNVEQLPDFEDYNMEGHTYRFFRGEPLYPFGYGLSYSKFAYGKPSFANGQLTLPVSNKSKRDGEETVLVYISKVGDTDGPIRTLRAFQRVEIPAGSTKSVSIPLPDSAFEWWDAKSNAMRILPGQYILQVGNQRLKVTRN